MPSSECTTVALTEETNWTKAPEAKTPIQTPPPYPVCHRDELWPGAPLLFYGVEDGASAAARLPQRTTGVTFAMDVSGTLELATETLTGAHLERLARAPAIARVRCLKLERGVFDMEEGMRNAKVYDDLERCYLLYYRCQKAA